MPCQFHRCSHETVFGWQPVWETGSCDREGGGRYGCGLMGHSPLTSIVSLGAPLNNSAADRFCWNLVRQCAMGPPLQRNDWKFVYREIHSIGRPQNFQFCCHCNSATDRSTSQKLVQSLIMWQLIHYKCSRPKGQNQGHMVNAQQIAKIRTWEEIGDDRIQRRLRKCWICKAGALYASYIKPRTSGATSRCLQVAMFRNCHLF